MKPVRTYSFFSLSTVIQCTSKCSTFLWIFCDIMWITLQKLFITRDQHCTKNEGILDGKLHFSCSAGDIRQSYSVLSHLGWIFSTCENLRIIFSLDHLDKKTSVTYFSCTFHKFENCFCYYKRLPVLFVNML